jgi:hypothetical protein
MEVEYDVRDHDGLAAAVAKFAQYDRDGGVLLVGNCSRCGHQMDVFVPLAPGTGVLGRGPAGQTAAIPLKSFEQVLRCNCQMSHSGRPAETDGCGALARVVVTQ